jgi:hypothetical protein
MSLSTYADFKAAVADWLTRADLEQQIPDFIRLADATLNKVIRSTRMTANADVTVNANARKGALPADMLETLYVQIKTDEDYPLEQVSPEQLTVLRRSRMRAGGTPRFYAVVGREIELVPTPSTQITLDVAYYRAIPALSTPTDSNWVLQYEPDLYLYTTLLHAAPFLQDEARASLFGNLLAQQVQAAVQQNRTVSLDNRSPGPSLKSPSDIVAK